MREEENSFTTHDATVIIRSKPSGYDFFKRGQDGDWSTYRKIRTLLKDNGYVFHKDVRVHYRSLRSTNHAGSKDDVHFTSDITPIGLKFDFYEDVVRDNRNGGRYHFDKLQKMPYLRRLKVALITRKICDLLISLGFRDDRTRVGMTPLEKILEDKRKDIDFRHHEIVADDQPDYNANDADKIRMKNGDIRSFWTRNGRLKRGRVHYCMNSMWWVITSHDELTKESAHTLFIYDEKKHGRKFSFDPIVKISHALERAVQLRDFKRAAAIQDAITRMTKPYDSFKAGDKVLVDNPRYKGPGIVEYMTPPFYVGVKVGEKGDGNTWRYEWATVRPAQVS